MCPIHEQGQGGYKSACIDGDTEAGPSSTAVKGGSAVPHRKGKATSTISVHDKPKKQVYQPKQEPQKPKNSIWANPNKYSYQSKAHAPRQSLSSCFVLKNNSKEKVIAKYVGNDRNVCLNTSI